MLICQISANFSDQLSIHNKFSIINVQLKLNAERLLNADSCELKVLLTQFVAVFSNGRFVFGLGMRKVGNAVVARYKEQIVGVGRVGHGF